MHRSWSSPKTIPTAWGEMTSIATKEKKRKYNCLCIAWVWPDLNRMLKRVLQPLLVPSSSRADLSHCKGCWVGEVSFKSFPWIIPCLPISRKALGRYKSREMWCWLSKQAHFWMCPLQGLVSACGSWEGECVEMGASSSGKSTCQSWGSQRGHEGMFMNKT